MNVVILEVSGSRAVAMTGEGQFINIRARRGMQPGCEFAYEEPAKPQALKFVTAVAAACVLLVMSSGLWQAFAVATRVDIEINPAVRISANAYGLVLGTEALNDDGRALLAGMPSGAFESLEIITARIIDRAVDEGYLKPDGRVSITVSDGDTNRAEVKKASLQTAADDTLREKNVKATVNTHSENAKTPKKTAAPAPAQTTDSQPTPHDNGKDATPAPESTAKPDKPDNQDKNQSAKPDKTQPGPKATKDANGGKKDGGNTDKQDKEHEKAGRARNFNTNKVPDSEDDGVKKGRSE